VPALDPRHRPITTRLLLESLAVFILLAAATLWVDLAGQRGQPDGPGLLTRFAVFALIGLQGCWFHRLYVIAHEASHRKLWPGHAGLNDLLGQLVLLPLMLPLRVHRKIHAFHHGHNRRDLETSALDTFVVRGRASRARRAGSYLLWYLAVFAGGWFLHSLVSVLLFLCMPLRLARRISPAFKGWRSRDQLRSIATFGLGLGLHLGVAWGLGARTWALTLGGPLLAFAWVYSLLVYIYHYETGYGPAVRDHARSLRPHPIASWWLLNFNEHATHHARPKLAWYRLPEHRLVPTPAQTDDQKVETIGAAILRQLQGPRIIELEPGDRVDDPRLMRRANR